MSTEAEIGVMQSQVKELWQPPEAGRVKEQKILLDPPEGVWPYQHPDFGPMMLILDF